MAEYPDEIRERLVGTPEQNATRLVGERPARWDHIVIEDYDPYWVTRFDDAAAPIRSALGSQIRGLEHVGSTSVPGLPAKPVIDIDLTLDDTEFEAAYLPPLEKLGYRLILREPWWHGHRMLIPPNADINLHVWPPHSPELVRHRLFRDWLRTHPDDRSRYADTKRRVARETAANPSDYNMAKNDVIDDIFTRIFAAPV
ncbi:GrpB-like predicted nucleotidyltransferase (UPF0157 family) [Actinoplanes tereljensis]|uniref:GrpB family protein n=1 Tax=Paractinoplanes tereljensis TaxID=571912 RepID=A0A919TRY5_9ACTN|nr:GrpB family protein [Actinoplanes tereljensis]GIF20808.1 hypothetical protein Ate02nite_35380 [Actinoplanes tereljensis]